jgi:hypothetical protein
MVRGALNLHSSDDQNMICGALTYKKNNKGKSIATMMLDTARGFTTMALVQEILSTGNLLRRFYAASKSASGKSGKTFEARSYVSR